MWGWMHLDTVNRKPTLDSWPSFEQKEQQTSWLTSVSVNGKMLQHQLIKLIWYLSALLFFRAGFPKLGGRKGLRVDKQLGEKIIIIII